MNTFDTRFCLKVQAIFSILYLWPFLAGAQHMLSGKVSDAATGEPIPFANVVIKSSGSGITTDFDGLYSLSVPTKNDTLLVSYVGYVPQVQAIGSKAEVNFSLQADVVNLEEIVFYAGENPAFEILRKLDERRPQHDPRSLEAYEYQSYAKTEIDLDHITEQSKQGGLLQKVDEHLEDMQEIQGEEGVPLIPIYLTETVSRMYVKNKPVVKRENIIKAQVKGVGLSADNWLSQLTSSAFMQYNFYQQNIVLAGKSFVSPLASTGRAFYDYELSDSLYLGDDFCYRLDFYPRQEQDLAFTGTVWITKGDYALRQIDAHIGKGANLNYVERIRIQQEMQQVEDSWLPAKTRVLIDSETFGNKPGLLLKYYSANQDFILNQEQSSRFYDVNVSLLEDAYVPDADYWEQQRPESLSDNEQQALNMIDTINNIAQVKRAVGLLEFAGSGYKRIGSVELGHYLYTYANNNVEGHRFRLGGRTNERLSKKWTFRAYGAYGTLDQKFKYGLGADYIIRRVPWTTVSVDQTHDLGQVGFDTEALQDGNELFLSASFFGDLEQAYRFDQSSVRIFQQLPFGLSTELGFRYRWIDPLFHFAYLEEPSDQNSLRDGSFTTSSLSLTARFARDERFVQQGNRRISLGTRRWPALELKYTLGLPGVLGSDFAFQKLEGRMSQKLRMGAVGTSSYRLEGSYLFGALPYPLLQMHLGNEGLFYTTAAYSTMLANEFASDRHISLSYQHTFQGFLLNRIPLIKKLKWRALATANVLYGGMSAENRNLMTDYDQQGNAVLGFSYLDRGPFVEAGYGIENIFRIFRIDAFHRLTYLDRPDVKSFRVLVSIQLKL